MESYSVFTNIMVAIKPQNSVIYIFLLSLRKKVHKITVSSERQAIN